MAKYTHNDVIEAATDVAALVYPLPPDGGYDSDHRAMAPIMAILLAAPMDSHAHAMVDARAAMRAAEREAAS